MHQQNTHQQFPDFTHPPPAIEQSLPSIDDSTIEQFLIDRNHITIPATEERIFNHFNVVNGRGRLHVIQTNLNNLIKRQQDDETNLKINHNIAQLSPSQWKEKINLLNQNQIKIAELLTRFETLSSKLTKATTTTKPMKRRNKRNLKKKRPHSTNQEPTNCKAEQHRAHVADDLEQSYEKYEVERLRTANLKRMNECKRQLTMLDSLIELRCMRRKNSNASGSGKGSSDKSFVEQIDQLKFKWSDALGKCNSQENELKTLLTNTSSQLWLNALFSNTEPPFSDEAMDLKKLLDIRKSWDLCLATDENVFGSSIPPGWVLPNATPTEEWASFLVE